MTFQQLTYVVEISKCGSINKAAHKLLLSQSGISTAVRELEEDLGIRFFTRSNRGVEFTPEGREFLGYAVSLLEQKPAGRAALLMECNFHSPDRTGSHPPGLDCPQGHPAHGAGGVLCSATGSLHSALHCLYRRPAAAVSPAAGVNPYRKKTVPPPIPGAGTAFHSLPRRITCANSTGVSANRSAPAERRFSRLRKPQVTPQA